MEGFSKIDIFDTKGIEYIFVIGYLLILIVFWKFSSKQVTKKIQKVIGNLSDKILNIPQGLFYNQTHTWSFLEKSGNAKVGLDDFLQHITGKIEFSMLKNVGEKIKKGELLTIIEQNGKQLRIFSPISGEVINTNYMLAENPELLNDDPYDAGWIYQIKPKNWIAETSGYFLAEEATKWSRKELDRFKAFVMGSPMNKYAAEPVLMVLQDGGELRDNILTELPKEVWDDFQAEFLNV
ncbi:MAG: glycine cleavage system protein H [Bacteroidetes bacterium]|jgi:glycine cleavage system H protein|nr:glycine cleavage system protein H [Bacteroidota bacterium]MBT5528223.1 glycine cleavage system protein H [Cytophagia bacterium]MBT3800405.1 glycine cleavage system protein H [Bacteroidota bacterium]MBT3934230.1 glycine cleavage system protein H [Bacteroidota bacterium]MBT4337069.1 glycine cleavage system protein H [Bacteroidota bacterium]